MVRDNRFDNSNGKHQRKDSMTTIEIEDQTKYKNAFSSQVGERGKKVDHG